MDESSEIFTYERKAYEGTLDEELKNKFEIDNKQILYYIIKELKSLFPNGINNILDVGGGIDPTLNSITQHVKINNAYSTDLYVPPDYI